MNERVIEDAQRESDERFLKSSRLPTRRRDRFQIYAAILTALRGEMLSYGYARQTSIGHLARLSYDKLKRYLEELEKGGLITLNDRTIRITDRGREFLQTYHSLISQAYEIDPGYRLGDYR